MLFMSLYLYMLALWLRLQPRISDVSHITFYQLAECYEAKILTGRGQPRHCFGKWLLSEYDILSSAIYESSASLCTFVCCLPKSVIGV